MYMNKLKLSALYRVAKNFFLDHINWCHPVNSDGSEKQPTWFYTLWCYLFWPIPWMEPEPCWCCASVRGVIYGFILGVALCLAMI